MSAIRQQQIEVLGVNTVVRSVGEPASEAVVFLHGNPGSSQDWEGLLERLAPIGRGLAFDLPGFGDADKPSDWDYGAGGHCVFIHAALRELGVERAHLVMHDLGGVALLWAAANPDAFASAVIIDTGLLIDFRWHPLARLYRAPVIGELLTLRAPRRGFDLAMRLYNPQPRKLPREFLDRMYAQYEKATRRAGLRFYRAAPPTGFERLVPIFRKLDRPALVVWGAHPPAVSLEQAERQRQSFPRAEVVVFPDSGHWPYIDDPDRAAETIIPFLQRQLDAAERA